MNTVVSWSHTYVHAGDKVSKELPHRTFFRSVEVLTKRNNMSPFYLVHWVILFMLCSVFFILALLQPPPQALSDLRDFPTRACEGGWSFPTKFAITSKNETFVRVTEEFLERIDGQKDFPAEAA